jgi:two-component system response regulator YesN
LYTIMIVDDEKKLRDGMKKFVPWEQYGFRVMQEAENGRQAFELLRQHPVDVLFLDVKMQGTNGIELLQQMRDHQIVTYVVIISGYDKFEYVKAALKHDVVEYLLKPVDIEEVVGILKKIRIKIESKRSEKATNEYMNDQLIQNLWYKLVNREGDEQTLKRISDSLKECFGECNLVSVLLGYDERPTITEQLLRQWACSDSNIVRVFVAQISDRVIAFLLITNDRCDPYGTEEIISGSPLPKAEGIAFSRMVSVNQQNKIDALMDLEKLTEELFFSEVRSRWGEHNYRRVIEYRVKESACQMYCQALQNSDKLSVYKALSEIYFDIQAGHEYTARSICDAYVILFKKTEALKVLIGVAIITEKEMLKVQERLSGSPTFHGLHKAMKGYLDIVFIRVEEVLRDTNIRAVKEIKEYVKEHLNDEILLKDAAKQLAMNSDYLSVLFKKETGMTFSQHVQEIRIEKAKELLLADPSLKIYTLAFEVGYRDSKHFSEVFKKNVGFSVKDYANIVTKIHPPN